MKQMENQAGPSLQHPFACLSGARILVADSNLDNQEILQCLFEEYGANLAFAHTVEEALAEIEQGRPRLLISELLLPCEGGHALIREVKAIEAEGSVAIPSIALTVCAKPEDRDRALFAGFYEYMAKPFCGEQLLALAANLIKSTR